MGHLQRLDSVENARFETQPPFSLQAASCNRVGIVIERLFVFFIRFLAVPMATDDDISERPHLQTA